MSAPFYSIEDLAGILKLHPKTILRFIHEGKIRLRGVPTMPEFTVREKEVLLEFLEEAVANLRAEIAASDKEEYRNMLKERKETLKGVLAKLG